MRLMHTKSYFNYPHRSTSSCFRDSPHAWGQNGHRTHATLTLPRMLSLALPREARSRGEQRPQRRAPGVQPVFWHKHFKPAAARDFLPTELEYRMGFSGRPSSSGARERIQGAAAPERTCQSQGVCDSRPRKHIFSSRRACVSTYPSEARMPSSGGTGSQG